MKKPRDTDQRITLALRQAEAGPPVGIATALHAIGRHSA